jgi:NhaC family Na+:H+ antiporter
VVAATLLLGSLIFYPVKFYWPLGIGALAAAAIAYRRGFSVRTLSIAAWGGMKATLIALSILVLVGSLIGVWMAAGTVPTLIYYGLVFASPRFLVPVAFLLALAVSMMLGTSVGTLSTLGVAIMGVAHGIGAPVPLVAGALVSGALFGDRSSPLSGSLNLNVAMTGTDLREMISRLWRTGGPAVAITLLLYGVAGFWFAPAGGSGGSELRESLSASVVISPWLLLPPVVVLGLSFARVKVQWALASGMLAGVVLAVAVGGQNLLQPVMAGLFGYRAQTGDAALDRILSGGGLFPMVHQVILILTAGALNGIMESTGMMGLVLERLVEGIRRPLALVASTMAISTAVAGLAANQALAIIIPGRMLRRVYQRASLPVTLLSRTLADSGTLLAGLIPWNVMSVLSATALGVSAATFAPYAFLAFVLPVLSLLVTYQEERRDAAMTQSVQRLAAGD